MPYWVSQEEGPQKDKIDAVIQAWREHAMSDREAWVALSHLYKTTRNRFPSAISPDDNYERTRDCGKGERTNIEYMITTWFPMYANLWFEGLRQDCYCEAKKLEQMHPGTKFAVNYEY